jgi:hypothetical protein
MEGAWVKRTVRNEGDSRQQGHEQQRTGYDVAEKWMSQHTSPILAMPMVYIG